jgi:hypothetical protein
MGFKWDVPPTAVFPQMASNYTKFAALTGRRAVEQRAPEAEAWMKSNAPWQDQTGRARAGLHVEVKDSPGVLTEMIFSHDDSLDYPVYLETRFSGRDAIIAKAVDYWGPILMRDIQRIINLGLATKG